MVYNRAAPLTVYFTLLLQAKHYMCSLHNTNLDCIFQFPQATTEPVPNILQRTMVLSKQFEQAAENHVITNV